MKTYKPSTVVVMPLREQLSFASKVSTDIPRDTRELLAEAAAYIEELEEMARLATKRDIDEGPSVA